MRNELKLLVLLPLYIGIILIFSSSTFYGDEDRYTQFALNLSHGYYSPTDANEINLWNGPGYPIVLLPFAALRLPWLSARLLNAVFLFGAVLLFYYTLRLYTDARYALYGAFAMGLCPPLLREIHLLYTEALAVLLVCGFAFFCCKFYRDPRFRWSLLVAAAGCLGFLALTKIFFGYVILAGLVLSAVLYLWSRRKNLASTVLIYALALVICLPYLFYTYSLTGKIFYWGNSGGLSLYCLSSPYANELGDWFDKNRVAGNPELASHHLAFFEQMEQLPPIVRDSEFKKQAIANITGHPLKFAKNWAANAGRLLFSYPYSYTNQKLTTFFFLVPGMFVFVLSVLCIYPTYAGRRRVPYEIFSLLAFVVVAFAGSSLLSAYSRQFWTLLPIIGLWIIFSLTQILRIEIRGVPPGTAEKN